MRRRLGSISLATSLFLVALAGITPVVVAAGMAIVALVDSQREAAEAKSLEVTRLAASAIDVKLQSTIASLRSLALSPLLDRSDLSEFSLLLGRQLAESEGWRSVSLISPDGRIVLGTHASGSDAAHTVTDTVSFGEVVTQRRPVIGRLLRRPDGQWGIAIRAPVVRNDKLVYVVSAVVSPEAFQRVVHLQGLRPDWTLSVFDAAGSRVARSRDASKYLGAAAAPSLRELMDRTKASYGVGHTTTLEGLNTNTAFVRLDPSRWSIAIGIPTASVLEERSNAFALYGGGALLSLLMAVLAAGLLAEMINRPIRELREAAEIFGGGGSPGPVRTGIKELSVLGDTITAAATGREAADRTLREQAQFIRATFEQAAVGIATATLDGRFDRVNQRFCEITGYSADELRQKRLVDITHPLDVQPTEDRVRDLLGGQVGSYDIEKRYVRKDGSTVWCKATVTLLRDHDNTWRWLLAAVDDISARKKAEQAQRRSEDIASTVVANSHDCIFMLEADSTISWANDVVVGELPKQAVRPGDRWIDIWRPEDRGMARDTIAAALSQGSGAMVGCTDTGDRSKRWDVRITAIRGSEMHPDQLLAVSREREDRFPDEGALRDEGRILEILNQTGIKLASQLDLKDLVQSVTDAGTELCGAQFGAFFYNSVDEHGDIYQLYTLSGAPVAAFSKFGQPRPTAIFAPTFAGGAPIRLDDVLADPRYGQYGPHHGMPKGHPPVRSYLAVSVTSRSGDVIGGLFFGHAMPGIFTERSERLVTGLAAQAAVAIDNARLYERSKQAAAERTELLESERAARAQAEREGVVKDEFLATLSHELRTPLSAILGWAQLLRRPDIGEEDRIRGVETIERNARVQTRLIDDLLDMSRIISGKVRLELQSLMPSESVAAAVLALRPTAEAKGIQLDVVLDDTAGPINGDPARLQQVVWNLLSNAIKFTPRGGKVHVAVRRVVPFVEVVVRDTGVGVTAEFLPRMFQRFRQADSSTTRRHGGLGLGLAICKQLVDLHGGTIEALSAGDHLGTTFTVRLPISALEIEDDLAQEGVERPTPALAPQFSPLNLSGVRVLVVDDDRDTRELIVRLLEDSKAAVYVAASAPDALALLQRHRPHVVVSDIGMPDMDGYQFLRHVRALASDAGGNTPVIAATAFARAEDRARLLQAGFVMHISKPVEPAVLLAAVASVAGRGADSKPEHWRDVVSP